MNKAAEDRCDEHLHRTGTGIVAIDSSREPTRPARLGDFACAILIDTLGRFLLQQRDDIPGILYPGKVGLFGGHREGDESYLQCVIREIHEEIGYFVMPEQFHYFLAYEGIVDVTGATAYGEIFIARDISVSDLAITEGSLLIVASDGIAEIEPKLSPSAHLALTTFLGGKV